jgi:hypothetical protein
MGGKLGTIFARAGHEVIFSYARSEQKLKTLARNAKGNARHGTPREAAQEADAVLLAVHWSHVDDVLKKAGDLSGKPVITCSLPMNDDNSGLTIGHTSSGAEELKKKLPTARVVVAFNTVPSEVLFSAYEAKRKARRPSLVYCGDDQTGKRGGRRAHTRRGLRARGCGSSTDRAIHRAVRPPYRRTRVRRNRGPRTGVCVRTFREAGTIGAQLAFAVSAAVNHTRQVLFGLGAAALRD